ncbi:MAG: hypothetical protein J6T35_05650 [Bacteroidales bacterium]|nr:hypothetical protein [Bacteroidales bacterium]
MLWYDHNCDRCWKSSRLKKEGDTKYEDEYTKIICAIQRDIFTRMYSIEPISQRTIDACHKADCPYRQEKRKKYEKHKNYPKLF